MTRHEDGYAMAPLFPQNGYDRLLTSARIVAYVDGTTVMQNERIGAALINATEGTADLILRTKGLGHARTHDPRNA